MVLVDARELVLDLVVYSAVVILLTAAGVAAYIKRTGEDKHGK
jgi:hypothetical protein